MIRADERWASIPGSLDYLVSDTGRILHLVDGGKWRLIKPTKNVQAGGGQGYWKVCLGRKRQAYVHLLVLAAFVGPCPEGMEGDHIVHDRANNALTNLRYRDAAENHSDNGWAEKVNWSAWDADSGRAIA